MSRACVMAYMWRLEDCGQELILHENLGNQIQVIGLNGKHIYLPSHFASPKYFSWKQLFLIHNLPLWRIKSMVSIWYLRWTLTDWQIKKRSKYLSLTTYLKDPTPRRSTVHRFWFCLVLTLFGIPWTKAIFKFPLL